MIPNASEHPSAHVMEAASEGRTGATLPELQASRDALFQEVCGHQAEAFAAYQALSPYVRNIENLRYDHEIGNLLNPPPALSLIFAQSSFPEASKRRLLRSFCALTLDEQNPQTIRPEMLQEDAPRTFLSVVQAFDARIRDALETGLLPEENRGTIENALVRFVDGMSRYREAAEKIRTTLQAIEQQSALEK